MVTPVVIPESDQKLILINSIQKLFTSLKKRKQKLGPSRGRDKTVAEEYNEFMKKEFKYPKADTQLRGKRKPAVEENNSNSKSEETVEYLNHKLSSTEAKLKRARSSVDYRDGKIQKLESTLAEVSSHSEGQVGEYTQCYKTIEE